MEKKRGRGDREKIMSEIVDTNIVASQPPNADRLEHRQIVPK